MILFEYFELTKLRFGQTTKKTKEKIVVRLDDLDLHVPNMYLSQRFQILYYTVCKIGYTKV